jgi:hypothetical protein
MERFDSTAGPLSGPACAAEATIPAAGGVSSAIAVSPRRAS